MNYLARRPILSMTLLVFLGLAGSAIVSLLVGLPVPQTHDEFSYLLAADTFAHGRLANPPHPMWVYFETFHVIQQPTYASKYPPAQGLVLALGQVIFQQPIVGVWLSVGVMAAATYWSLSAWMPPRWAFLAGLLMLVCWGVASYWSQSYWGGAVAAAGGALLYGALRRIICVERARTRNTVVFGLSLALLANSRPFEGLLVAIPAGGLLGAWLLVGRNRPPVRTSLAQIVAPLALVVVATAFFMGFYNYRVTGTAWKLPYVLHEQTYSLAPFFIWQSPRPMPTYHHDALRVYHTERNYIPYTQQRTWSGFPARMAKKAGKFWDFYLGIALVVPLLALPWAVRNRWTAFAAAVCISFIVIEWTAITPFFAHYAAPIAPLLMLLIVQGLRHLRLWQLPLGSKAARPVGRWVFWALLVIYLTAPVLQVSQAAKAGPSAAWSSRRTQLQAQLAGSGGKHLVIVRYGTRHHVDHEWVYNAADIDAAPVVWARDMGPGGNQALLDYFKDRSIWLLTVDDQEPFEIKPYSESGIDESSEKTITRASSPGQVRRGRLADQFFQENHRSTRLLPDPGELEPVERSNRPAHGPVARVSG